MVEILIEHTERDAELHARLRELHDCGAYYLITLDLFQERHAPEVVRILRERLSAAAKRDFPEFPDVVEHVSTLVQMATWWAEAVAGGNPPRTDSYS